MTSVRRTTERLLVIVRRRYIDWQRRLWSRLYAVQTAHVMYVSISSDLSDSSIIFSTMPLRQLILSFNSVRNSTSRQVNSLWESVKCRQRLKVRRQGLVVQGQGQEHGLVNWSSRTRTFNDRGQQHCCECLIVSSVQTLSFAASVIQIERIITN